MTKRCDFDPVKGVDRQICETHRGSVAADKDGVEIAHIVTARPVAGFIVGGCDGLVGAIHEKELQGLGIVRTVSNSIP